MYRHRSLGAGAAFSGAYEAYFGSDCAVDEDGRIVGARNEPPLDVAPSLAVRLCPVDTASNGAAN